MTLLYADTSAIVGAYLADEPDHAVLRELLLEGDETVVVSEIARVELASAVMAATRARRLPSGPELLKTIDRDCRENGRIDLLALRRDVILPTAHRLVLEHNLRALDAIHLAVAIEECPNLAGESDVAFVTRDALQGTAARSLGLAVR